MSFAKRVEAVRYIIAMTDGARYAPSLCSTASSMMPRMSKPVISAFTRVRQPVISRYCGSMVKPLRRMLLFHELNSNASEHPSSFERTTMTFPSWTFSLRSEYTRAGYVPL